MRLKHDEATLTLNDEGIGHVVDGQSGLRSYTDLRGVRLQAVHGGKNRPWEALLELRFRYGQPLVVYSNAPWGGDDPRRDAAFVAFVEALHRRIPPDAAARIIFRRGVSEGHHRIATVAWVVFLAVFGGAGLAVLYFMLAGRVPFFPALGSLVGLVAFGFWMNSLVEKNRPGSYSPEHLPRDLYPERR